MRVIWFVPLGPLLLLGSVMMFSEGAHSDPEKMNPISISDYQHQSKAYIYERQKENALSSCEQIRIKHADKPLVESFSDRCLLEVYGAFNDIDEEIRLYEKMLAKEIAAGDSGALTKHVLEGLYEKKERRENSKFKRFQPLIDRLTVP